MTNPLAPQKECRGWSRINKTATLQVKQLSYPLPAGPGDAGVLNNISEEGICFSLERPYRQKDQLCLSIDLLGWQHHKQSVALLVNENLATAPLTAIVEVVWVHQQPEKNLVEFGARFLDIFEDDHKALKTYLANIRKSLELNA